MFCTRGTSTANDVSSSQVLVHSTTHANMLDDWLATGVRQQPSYL